MGRHVDGQFHRIDQREGHFYDVELVCQFWANVRILSQVNADDEVSEQQDCDARLRRVSFVPATDVLP